MLKKIFLEPAFLILLAGNAWCIWYFLNYPNGFDNVIWIYWVQSVVIGLFNFLDLLTIKNFTTGDMRMNGEPITEKNKGCTAWFFLLHYGFFHFGYMIFLAVQFHSGLNGRMILLGAAAFFLEALITYRRKKAIEATRSMSLGSIFFLPYLRIVPIHLTIMAPAFLHVQPSVTFIILKTFADIILYFVTRRMYRGQLTES